MIGGLLLGSPAETDDTPSFLDSHSNNHTMTDSAIQANEALFALLDEDDVQSTSDSEVGADEATGGGRCKYPSKPCDRLRARKSNGTYHRFCQYHRIKANTNQKRWTSVRRRQAILEDQQRRRDVSWISLYSMTPAEVLGNTSNDLLPKILPELSQINPSSEPIELALEDLWILNALFGCDASKTPNDWHKRGRLHEPMQLPQSLETWPSCV